MLERIVVLPGYVREYFIVDICLFWAPKEKESPRGVGGRRYGVVEN